MKTTLLAFAVTFLATGCAAPEAATENTSRERDYVTGSNIPRKNKDAADRVQTVTGEELERFRTSAPVMPPASSR